MEAQRPGLGLEPGSGEPGGAPPATIGPYVVMRSLGGGAMGVVSLCRTFSGRLVAVKQVREEYADDPAFRSRFRREVAAARRVRGVYTVPVVDADTDGHRPWVATAYVPGPTLDQAVGSHGSFREPAVRALGAGLAEALQAIHAAGLVHRDLKPGNVLLGREGPRVIDFGITRALGETRLTRTGALIGSPAFMAPEQVASSHDVGPECDIFALAGVLVYAACGEGPFGPGDKGTLQRIVTQEPDLHGVPAALHLLLHCLDKTPSRRPSPEDVLALLAPTDPEALRFPALREDLAARAREAELLAVVPPPPGAVPGSGRKEALPSRRRALIGGLSALGVLAAGSVAAAVWMNSDDGDTNGDNGKDAGAGKPLGSAVPDVVLTDPPRPLWTTGIPIYTSIPQLDVLGSTLVLQDSMNTAAGLDTAGGTLRWRHNPGTDGKPARDDVLALGERVLGHAGTELVFSGLGTGLAAAGDYFMATASPATARVRSKNGLPTGVSPVAMLTAHGTTAYCMVNKVGAAPSFTSTQAVAAIDLDHGTIRWQKSAAPGALNANGYVADGRGLYYAEGTDDGLTLHALDAADGSSRWSQKVTADPDGRLQGGSQSNGYLDPSLTAAGDLLIAVDANGGLTAYDAARSGTAAGRWP
ncbi:protein kinase [Streptomyces sp. TS71-3]|uniref:protein kinase domain-containing protein n=1 Tax=Streptomyces sp. TS71-3 TaxID=2733862 RepID=UPI001B07DC8E|nr:protein kinase [Streptomyces sp. TS71-3]GHJ41809.1 hypothetical protein Sm713_74180 [Streptomyces sp. TS71-3]